MRILASDTRTGRTDGNPTSTDDFPTTAAYLDGRLLVVNPQFNARESGNPALPFTVSSIPTWKLTRSL